MALDLLARDVDPKKHSLVMIDYKTLGVRHLGSIYEGLLEFTIRIAGRKLGITKQDGNEVYTPFADLDERQQVRAEREGRVVKKGRVYLENDKHERKASGSYYTPDHIVKYIVENTVGPVLSQKFDALRPKVREMQAARRAFFKKQEALKKQGLKPQPDSKADLIGQDLADEFFDSKVLDPAMGSGHFLVEAVDFITDKTLDFLSGFPTNPVFAYLGTMRKTILQEMEQSGITIDKRS
jgi:type I restriction-modification system DNA methylase subunit